MKIDLTLQEERANLFSALSRWAEICLSQNDETDDSFILLLKVWEKVSGKLWFECYWNDYFHCGKIVLKAARYVNDVKVQAQLLGELGYACMEGENFVQAQQCFQESLQKYQLLKEFSKECKLLRYLGNLANRQKQYELALEHYQQAWDILKTKRSQIPIDDQLALHEAELPNVIGCVYLELRDFSASYQQFNLSLKNYQVLLEDYPQKRIRYRYYQTELIMNLGKCHFLQGDYEQARRCYEDCLLVSREISRNDTMATVLLSLAELAEVEGNKEEAIKLASESERVAGTEITSVRERAAIFKEKLLSKTMF
ncbi:tetratricopeptide repeat protein [Microcoleus sp. BR0-C5]|uniref:tetratricopeptide repeat protein n=1 Tax=Microcoleus sp. BR0-C5 TaxID=2818713 RepID=UPI002FD4159F